LKPEIIKDNKVAVVIGCEGFVGEHLLKLLTQHKNYRKVLAVSLGKIEMRLPEVKYFISTISDIDFKRLAGNDLFICYDASFFNAGGKYKIPESQYKHIPKMVLKAYRSGIGQVILLSSKSTDSDALFNVSRARGLVEEVVGSMGFWATHIFRPSILLGESINQNWGKSIADKIGNKVDQITGGWLKRNRPIEAEIVARAMLSVAQRLEEGKHIYSSEWLQDFATSSDEKTITKNK
jgi:uncharacterized protein YbjT (DUF2867 family)